MKKRRLLFATAFLFSLQLSGCVFLNGFQSPKVLDRGETVIGIGASGFGFVDESDSGSAFGIPEVHARFNIGRRTDVGLRTTFGAIGGDLKFQVFDRNPFYGAISVGGSGAYLNDVAVFTFTPAFILGTEKFYGGIKHTTIGGGSDADYEIEELGTAVFLGGQIGKGRVKFVPEMALYSNQNTGNIFTFGGAVQFHLK